MLLRRRTLKRDIEPFVAEPCTYTTTRANESVTLINYQQYAKKITLEDGTDVPITGTGYLNYTFADIGEHKVYIEFKEDVTDFWYCFSGCSELTSIPENFFANCPNVINFNSCFYNCSGLTGSCPVDNDGTPIYNRSGNGKPGYAKVTSYRDCFYNCTGLTDYSSIPSSWGGGGA